MFTVPFNNNVLLKNSFCLESGYISCQDKETDLTCLKQESNSGIQSGFLGVLGETLEAQFGSLEDTASSKKANETQGEGFDADRRYEQSELTIDEGIEC